MNQICAMRANTVSPAKTLRISFSLKVPKLSHFGILCSLLVRTSLFGVTSFRPIETDLRPAECVRRLPVVKTFSSRFYLGINYGSSSRKPMVGIHRFYSCFLTEKNLEKDAKLRIRRIRRLF